MKPYTELSYLGRLRRIRLLAQQALAAYGMGAARFRLLRQAGNTLFRVYTVGEAPTAGDLFEPGQYLLRIHEPGYQAPDAIELELHWLAAMRREADLPVQEPVPSLDGRFLIAVEHAGVPQARFCSLLRWIKGRSAKRHVRPAQLRAQGWLMARMHDVAVRWQPPAGLSKRRFDWDGLFQNDVGSGMPNAEAWALLPERWRGAFEVVAQRTRQVMEAWGQGPEVYGLIHGDLAVDANLLFWHGEPRAIDFDDSGYGYWIYDLAVALEYCWGEAAFPRNREALLAGYTEHRSLPPEQLAQLELFIAATEVYWNLWAAGGTHLYPQYRAGLEERIQRTAELVVRFVERG